MVWGEQHLGNMGNMRRVDEVEAGPLGHSIVWLRAALPVNRLERQVSLLPSSFPLLFLGVSLNHEGILL